MPKIYVLSKNKKNVKNIHLKIIISEVMKNCNILHRRVFVKICYEIVSSDCMFMYP